MLDLIEDRISPDQLPKISDKRQSFRWPVTGPRQEAELRFGEKRLKVQLLDESAGGFSALCEHPIGVELGAKGLLCANEDWFDVCVANIEPVAPSPIDEDDGKPLPAEFFQPSTRQPPADPVEPEREPLQDSPPTLCRVGLARLGDAYNPDIQSSYHSWAGLSCQLKQVSSGTLGVVFVGIVLAMTVVIIPFTSIQLLSSDKADAELKGGVKWLDRQKMSVFKPVDKHRSNADDAGVEENSLVKAFVGDSPKASTETPKAADTHSSREPKSSFQLGDKFAELRKTIQRMPGAMPFALPDVVKQLQLTPSQQKRIQELVDAAADMIKNLGSASGKSGKEILDSTRNKVLDLLDNNQKKKWIELTGESEKDANDGKK